MSRYVFGAIRHSHLHERYWMMAFFLGEELMLMWVQQFHQTERHVEKLEPLLQASKGTMRIAKWDGAAEFWAERAEDFVEFMECVYGAEQLVGMLYQIHFSKSLSLLSLSNRY
jgi:hypothetical protein